MAQRLTPHTRDALLQNQSLLSSTAGEVDAVRVVTKQWQRHVHPDTLIDLPKYHHVVSTTIDGQVTTPFKVRGPVVTEVFAEHLRPERLTLQRKAIDTNLHRRRIGEVLQELETLDERIRAAITATHPPAPEMSGPTGRGRMAARAGNRGEALAGSAPEGPAPMEHECTTKTREGWA